MAENARPTNLNLQKDAKFQINETTFAEWDSVNETVKLTGNVNVSSDITFGDGESINDTNGAELLAFGVTASAVNELTVNNAATGTAPSLEATGDDTNVGVDINTKGAAAVNITTQGTAGQDFGLYSVSTDAGGAGAIMGLKHLSASPAANDSSLYLYIGYNDNEEETVYAAYEYQTEDVTNGSEEGSLAFKVMEAGTPFTEYIRLNENGGKLITINRCIAVDKENITAGTGGAINLTSPTTTVNTDAGGDAFSLANGADGQRKTIILVVDGGGDAVITPATFANGTTITLDTAGDSVVLEYDTTIGWVVVGGQGYAVA